jgi:hypothetical protein
VPWCGPRRHDAKLMYAASSEKKRRPNMIEMGGEYLDA